MLKTGYHLSREKIIEGYSKLSYRRGVGREFNLRVLSLAGNLNGTRILDVGCGYGELLEEIAKHYSCELYGIDFINIRINELIEKLKGKAVIKNSDIQKEIPFSDEYFDIVFSIEVLEHLKEPDKCIGEIKRVVKKNGKIIISIPNATGYSPFIYFAKYISNKWLQQKLLPYEYPSISDQPIDTCYEYFEILDLFKRNGLRIKKIVGLRYFRYLQTLPLIRDIYNILYPFVDWSMAKLNGKKFAYNLLFLCDLIA